MFLRRVGLGKDLATSLCHSSCPRSQALGVGDVSLALSARVETHILHYCKVCRALRGAQAVEGHASALGAGEGVPKGSPRAAIS